MALLQNVEETHLSRWLVFFLSARFKDCLKILLEIKINVCCYKHCSNNVWAFQANSGLFLMVLFLCPLTSHLPWQWQFLVTQSCHPKSDKLVSEAFGKVLKSFLVPSEGILLKMSLNVIKMIKVTHTRPSAVGVSEVFSNLYLSPWVQGE